MLVGSLMGCCFQPVHFVMLFTAVWASEEPLLPRTASALGDGDLVRLCGGMTSHSLTSVPGNTTSTGQPLPQVTSKKTAAFGEPCCHGNGDHCHQLVSAGVHSDIKQNP